MTSAEVALVAALGSSGLTGLVALGVFLLQDGRQRKAANRSALHSAYAKLLTRSMSVAMRARALGETARFRSGLTEGIDIVTRQRKPVDGLELHDWMAQDLVPLNEALDEIWTRADQEGIRLANDVVSKCADLLGGSTSFSKPTKAWERIRTWAAGVRWTPEMIAENDRSIRALALARKRLAEHVRVQFGRSAVQLFTSDDAQEEQPVPDRLQVPKIAKKINVGDVPAADTTPG